jgi:hypothetical protein
MVKTLVLLNVQLLEPIVMLLNSIQVDQIFLVPLLVCYGKEHALKSLDQELELFF